jgi:hypothetical protein
MILDPASLLTEDDMTKPRDASVFIEWWDMTHAEFGRSKAGREYCRSGTDPLVKRFYEELLPLARSMKRLAPLMPGLVCQPTLATKFPDAWMWCSEDSKIPLEITCAKDGFHEALQSLEMEKKGWVNATFPPQVQGQGRNKKVLFIEDEMRECRETDLELKNLIQARLASKSAKNYQDNPLLIIDFDDSRLDVENWPDWVSFCSALKHPFRGLLIVGDKFSWHDLGRD